MKKVFHFDSQTDLYRADACVVSCFDARFELVTRKFLKKRAIWWADPLKVAGGAKLFASPAEESERSFALAQVQTSMRLHRTNRVILMVHSDCGACRNSAATKSARQRTTKPNCAPPMGFCDPTYLPSKWSVSICDSPACGRWSDLVWIRLLQACTGPL